MANLIENIDATVVRGHQIASGTTASSPYPAGTIALQKPHFKALGLDLSACYDGTLNLQLDAKSFSIKHADYCFENLRWIDGVNPETFSFVACQIECGEKCHPAWIYYPHPDTKTQHFQPDNLIEVLTEKIADISYGSRLALHYDHRKLQVD